LPRATVCADPDGAGIAADAVLGPLLRLVDKSLVVAEPVGDGTARYRLPETLRQYARERLVAGGAAPALQARHAAYFLALAEPWARAEREPGEPGEGHDRGTHQVRAPLGGPGCCPDGVPAHDGPGAGRAARAAGARDG
jgi:hypothetical protein